MRELKRKYSSRDKYKESLDEIECRSARELRKLSKLAKTRRGLWHNVDRVLVFVL
jgi:hypothetical protein